MPRSFTETVGMLETLLAYMQDPSNRAALTAKGFDAVPHQTRLQSKQDNVSRLNSEQETLKNQLARKTEALKTALSDSYVDGSGVIDAMMGMLGKNSREAKNLQRIRSSIRRGATETAGPTAPAPAGAPAAS